jgi:hypothetical protein
MPRGKKFTAEIQTSEIANTVFPPTASTFINPAAKAAEPAA